MTTRTANVQPPPIELDQIIERSKDLRDLIASAWQASELPDEPRARAVEGLCLLTIEHATSIQLLIDTCPASAIVLMRPQYESLVRAVWVTHAAAESDFDRLLAPLTLESQQAAKKLPGIPEMLASLEKSGQHGAARLLARARARLGDGLNSYIHGGIHPFARMRDGYATKFLADMQRNSNALSILTLIVLAEISFEMEVLELLDALNLEFKEVLPVLEPFDVPAA